MQSTRWTSGCLEAIQRQLGPALRAKLHVVTTIIIEGEEAYATGCASVGELLRYALPEAAAGEPVLEAQGERKSEGRACAKVCGRLCPGKGESAGLLCSWGVHRLFSA